MFSRIKNFFVPHAGNNFRPDVLEQFSMGVMLVLILLSFAIANLQALLWISSDWLVSTILPATIVTLTNSERDTDALRPLLRSDVLDQAAELKARDMAENGYFAHYSPTGVSPWHWFDTVGYDYLHAGENLAVHFTDSDAVVDAWMESPTHRANILNGDYEEIGVGSAKGVYNGQETIFVVQLFGTKRLSVPNPATQPLASASESPTVAVERVTETNEEDVAPATVRTETLTPVPRAETPSLTEASDTLDTTAPSPLEVTREGVRESDAVTQTESPSEEKASTASAPLRVATDPSLWLQTFYAVLALLVIGSLLISLLYEWRKHHLLQTAYASGLLAVMALLLYVHTMLTGQVTIV